MHFELGRRLVATLLALASCTGAAPTTHVVNSGHLRHGAVALLTTEPEPAAEGAAAAVGAVTEAEESSTSSSESAMQEAEQMASDVQDPAAASTGSQSNLQQPASSANEQVPESTSPTSGGAGLHEDPANADVIDETERLAAQAEAEAATDNGSDDSAAAAAALSSAGLAEADLDGVNSAVVPAKSVPVNAHGKPSRVDHLAVHFKTSPIPTTQAQAVLSSSSAAVAVTTAGPVTASISTSLSGVSKVAARDTAVGENQRSATHLSTGHAAATATRPAAGVAPVVTTAAVEHRMLRANRGSNVRKAAITQDAADDEKPVPQVEASMPPGITSGPGEPLEEKGDTEMSEVKKSKEARDEEAKEEKKSGKDADEKDEMLEAEKLEEKKQEEEEQAQERKLKEEEEELEKREQRYAHEEAERAIEKQRRILRSSRSVEEARDDREGHEVDRLQEQIAKDTNSSALAEMLSLIKMESYQLNHKLDMLHKEIEDGVELEPENPNDSLIYPLSTCMRCCIMMAVQYFFVFTAMATCKAFTNLFGFGEITTAEQALSAACDTVYYAPMLCLLFLGAELRALQITEGKGGPQDWAEIAMQVCAWCLLVQTLLVFAIPIFTGGAGRVPDKEIPRSENAAIAGLLELLRYVSLIGLYAGFTVVCIAVVLMDARSLGAKPVDLWDNPTTAETEYSPPVSVAMTCLMTLTVFFFMIHLAHALLWSCIELTQGQSEAHGSLRTFVISCEQFLQLCKSAVDLAPILCALFIAIRMRAMQLDPKNGRPQSWAEACFYVIVFTMVVQPAWTVLLILTGEKPNIVGDFAEGDLAEVLRSPVLRRVLLLGNYLNMSAMYVACFAMLLSAFLLQATEGRYTPPVSPTMFCVITLAILHLGTYLCLFLFQILGRSLRICQMVEQVMKLGPMLAVLFLSTRVRALQLSKQKGSPQCWAQDAMYVAVGAVLAEVFLVLVLAMFTSESEAFEGEEGEMGKGVRQCIRMKPQRIALQVLQAAFCLLFHGSVIIVVASTLTVRPETAACPRRGYPGVSG